MKKNSGKQAVINFIGQHPGCSFQDIRRGTGLDSSVVNSSLWQMHRDGQVNREGECRSYHYTPDRHNSRNRKRSVCSVPPATWRRKPNDHPF